MPATKIKRATSRAVAAVANQVNRARRVVSKARAAIHNEERNFDRAIVAAEKAMALDKQDAEAHFQLALAYANLGKYALAYTYFRESVALDASRAALVGDNIQSIYAKHYNAGLLAKKHEHYAGALFEFRRAAEADPRQGVVYYQMATSYEALGDRDGFEKALDALKRSLGTADVSERSRIEEAIHILQEAHEPAFDCHNLNIKPRGHDVQVLGEITNKTGISYKGAVFTAGLYDANNVLLALTRIVISNFRSGQTRSFQTVVEVESGLVNDCKVEFECGC